MTLAKDFEDFVQLLNKRRVAYMVVGGYALGFHGNPRSTGDIDIWIKISAGNARKMIAVLHDFGLSSMDFSIQDFLKPGYITQIGYPPLRIDILNSIDGIDFDQAEKNVQSVELEPGLQIKFIGLKELIINKQASGRKQDLKDIQEIKRSLHPKKNVSKKGKHL
jgi:predicted nucleotidyltransferase